MAADAEPSTRRILRNAASMSATGAVHAAVGAYYAVPEGRRLAAAARYAPRFAPAGGALGGVLYSSDALFARLLGTDEGGALSFGLAGAVAGAAAGAALDFSWGLRGRGTAAALAVALGASCGFTGLLMDSLRR